jgi:hypothetical protein
VCGGTAVRRFLPTTSTEQNLVSALKNGFGCRSDRRSVVGIVQAEVILAAKSGILTDGSVNTFTFRTATTAIATADLDLIRTALTEFYNTAAGGNVPSAFLASRVDRGANKASIKYYDISAHLDGTAHGSPLRIDQWTIAGANPVSDLPAELAIAVSYHSAYGSDPEFAAGSRPRARDRGRIYFGPLGGSTMTIDASTNETRVNAAVRTTLSAAAARLMAHTDVTWQLWSRKKATIFPVVGGWVDDAFDVQRRRGNLSLARTSYGA